jgi:hypothetical protein
MDNAAIAAAPPGIRSVAAGKSLWRWLRPSFTDLFFLFVIYWLCIAAPGSWQSLLKDGDTGMHLRTGDWIAAHGKVPDQDIFSYTQPGAPWYAFQWCSAVLYSKLNADAGIKAVAFVSGIAIALWIAVLMQAMIGMRVQGLMAIFLALAAGNAASIHYLARPHLFTMLFLGLSVWLVETDREHPSRRVWLLVPLTVLWTNIHSGFVILPAYLGAICVGTFLEDGGIARAKRWAAIFASCVAATLVNPYGIKLHLHILSFLSGPVATKVVDEYQSPQFRGEPMYWFLLLLFAALMMAGISAYRRSFTDAAVILLFAAAALTSARNIPLFMTAALPAAARCGTRLWKESKALPSFYELGATLTAKCSGFSVWSIVAVLGVALLTSANSWPTDLDPHYFPTDLIQRNRTVFETQRVFTTDQWGDDLIYTFRGKVPVFIDGRSDFYGARIVNDYVTILNGGTAWKALLDKYQINAVLAPAGSPLWSLLTQDPSWWQKDRVESAALFLRN